MVPSVILNRPLIFLRMGWIFLPEYSSMRSVGKFHTFRISLWNNKSSQAQEWPIYIVGRQALQVLPHNSFDFVLLFNGQKSLPMRFKRHLTLELKKIIFPKIYNQWQRGLRGQVNIDKKSWDKKKATTFAYISNWPLSVISNREWINKNCIHKFLNILIQGKRNIQVI